MTKNTSTPIDLPPPIAAYFTAGKLEADALARCFSETAIVVDEGGTHRGRAAIAAWQAAAFATYRHTSEPLAAQVSSADVSVKVRVMGDFPGSPIELRYRFMLDGDTIAKLEIAP